MSKLIDIFFITLFLIFGIVFLIESIGILFVFPFAIVLCAILCFFIHEGLWRIFEYFYYKSEKFCCVKESLKLNAQNVNELNLHIEELSRSLINVNFAEQGNATYKDDSFYNFKRPMHKELSNKNNIYDCSLSVCRNARMQPIKYLCKYFNIPTSEKSSNEYEKVLNNYAAAEQGKELLIQEREDIIANLGDEVPYLLKILRKKQLLRNLGFDDILFKKLYFPKYRFRYISAGGNSSLNCDINLDMENLENLVSYLAQKVKFKKSVKGQRAMMTRALREYIKKRDNYTCQICGLSTKDEPNLLLEIDHIIPVSKGGITSEDNLQTLCWKCNRTKSNNIINHKKNRMKT